MEITKILLCLALVQASVFLVVNGNIPEHEACYMQGLYTAFVPTNRNIQFAVVTLDHAGRDTDYTPTPSNPHQGNLPSSNPQNYLVRTRDNTEHAEIRLINEAEGMITNYRRANGNRLPNTLHILSYLEPCSHCGQALVNFLRNYASQGVQVFMAFMAEFRRNTQSDRIQTMMAFGGANIPYDQIAEPHNHDELRRRKRSTWCKYQRPSWLRSAFCGTCLA